MKLVRGHLIITGVSCNDISLSHIWFSGISLQRLIVNGPLGFWAERNRISLFFVKANNPLEVCPQVFALLSVCSVCIATCPIAFAFISALGLLVDFLLFNSNPLSSFDNEGNLVSSDQSKLGLISKLAARAGKAVSGQRVKLRC